jgi:hypothetical protein
MRVLWEPRDITGPVLGMVITSKTAHPGGERWMICFQTAPGQKGANYYARASLSDGMVTTFMSVDDFAADLNASNMWPEAWLK